MNNTAFAQSVAWIRVLETKLLSENELERMVLAKDATDAYKVLNETDYSSHIGDIENVESFEEVINAGLKDAKELVNRIAPQNWMFNILWFRYDTHNMKVLVKAKNSDKTFEEVENYLFHFGAIPVEALKKYILDGEEPGFGLEEQYEKYMKESIQMADAGFKKDDDPQMIDIILDKRFIIIMNEIAKKTNNAFLLSYAQKYTDLKNVELFIRLKAQDRDETLLLKGLIDGGVLEKYRFIDSYRKDISDFAESLKHTDYGQIIRDAVKGYEDENSFVDLDKLSYDYLNNFIQNAKRMSLGPEPVFSYFWAKKNNALIIRAIMVGKLNGIEPENIRKMIRKLY